MSDIQKNTEVKEDVSSSVVYGVSTRFSNNFRPQSVILVIIAFGLFCLGALYVSKYVYKSKASQAGLSVLVSGVVPSNADNQTVNAYFILQPTDTQNSISGFDLALNNAGDDFVIQKVTPQNSVTDTNSSMFTQVGGDNINTVKYVINKATSDLPKMIVLNVSILVNKKGSADSHIGIDVGNSQVVGPIPGYAYAISANKTIDFGPETSPTSGNPTETNAPTSSPSNTPVPTNTPIPTSSSGTPTTTPKATSTPTPTSTSDSKVTMNLKLKFFGINSKPQDGRNTTDVKVTLQKISGTSYSSTKTVTFTSDANGIWSGTTNFDATAGPGYTVLVKGSKHLQKKFCVINPVQNSTGWYQCGNSSITLVSGANSMDFSAVSLLPGDLAINNGAQRGVVDSLDLNTVRKYFGHTDSEALTLADLNLDGVVDTQDYSLVLHTLSVYNDEE
ncbi:hypothetical protein HGA88_04980 [Candidatus Roizmanbacteria bacterium]|nr:hypothetical protein [Candidatus Roizmanbacteria bacterium]